MEEAVEVVPSDSEVPAREFNYEHEEPKRKELTDATASARSPAVSFADSVVDLAGMSRRPFLLRNLSNFSDRLDYFNLLWIPRNSSDQRRSLIRVKVRELDVNREMWDKLLENGARDVPKGDIVANIALQLIFEDASGRKTAFTTASRPCRIRSRMVSNCEELSLDMTAMLTFLRRFPKKVTLGLILSHRHEKVTESSLTRLRKQAQLCARTTLYDSEMGSSAWIKKGLRSISMVYESFSAICESSALRGLAGLSPQSVPPQRGTAVVIFDLFGGPEWTGLADLGLANGAKDVHVSMTYTSKGIPQWNGIQRHDFVCPWCHLTTKRLRSLLMHLQVDHRNPRFTMDGPTSEHEFHDPTIPSCLEVQLNVQILKLPCPRHVGSGAVHERSEICRDQDHSLAEATGIIPASDSTSVLATATISSHMTSVRPTSDEKCATYETRRACMANQPDPDVVVCSYCSRKYLRPLNWTVQNTCCGDWCFLLQESAKRAAVKPVEDCPPLISFASPNRGQTIDFRSALGKRELYHVISVAPFPESHFNENDPDSEDEVDHSWRLTIQEEDITALPVSSKHKLLWTMWNRHIFRNGSCGSYGYQFTRYEVEMFAIEMRQEVSRLGLRVHFVAFLRALHIYGHIDSEAVISALQCLDHRKKRRACKISRRPRKSFMVQKFPGYNG